MSTNSSDVASGLQYFYITECDISDFCNLQWKFNKSSEMKVVAKMIRGEKCTTLHGLFHEFSAALQFPYYFGENWNSFDECVNDLEWLPADAYILCISHSEQILKLPSSEVEIFFRTLLSAGQEWMSGRDLGAITTPSTPFKVVFHCTTGTSQNIIIKFHDLGIELRQL